MTSDEKKPSRREPWRAPGWVIPILCAAVGYFMARTPGAIFAGLLGVGVWLGRR